MWGKQRVSGVYGKQSLRGFGRTVTKVQGETLQFIEANRYHELPAPVYLRGFLKEIAKCLRLDPARVANSYMQGYRDTREGRA